MSTGKLVVGATLLPQDGPPCSDKLSSGSIKIDYSMLRDVSSFAPQSSGTLDGTAIIRLIDYPTVDSPRNSSGMVASCCYCGGRSLPLNSVDDREMASIQVRPVWVRMTHASHASRG